jgi:hypothetical protein
METTVKPTQSELTDFVSREVQYCVSSLVHHFATNPEALKGSDYSEDDLYAILSQPDYEGPARDEGYKVVATEEGYFRFIAPDAIETGFVSDDYDTRPEAWQAACEHGNLEEWQDEALEHWIVSDWLANKLEAKGEMVTTDFFGLTIWGRTTSGQAIMLDSVIEAIYIEMKQ